MAAFETHLAAIQTMHESANDHELRTLLRDELHELLCPLLLLSRRRRRNLEDLLS